MSSYDIQSMRQDVNELSRQVREIRSINNALQNDINLMVGALDFAGGGVENMRAFSGNQLNRNIEELSGSRQNLQNVEAIRKEIVELNTKYKSMESARKKIRALHAELAVKDENCLKVNRLMIAIVDYLSGVVVDFDNLKKNVEAAHLSTKEYYLSHTMMSVVGWIDGDRVSAEAALVKAMELSSNETTLFFFVFWLQQRRYDAARKWFELLDKKELSQNDGNILFLITMISLGLGTHNIDKEFDEQIQKFMLDLYEGGKSDSKDKVALSIGRWYLSMAKKSTITFALLSSYVSEYSTLEKVMSLAETNQSILEELESLTQASGANSRDSYIIKVLEDYIEKSKSSYGKDIASQIAEQEVIISKFGDEKDAFFEYTEYKIRQDSKINLNEQLYYWLTNKDGFAGEEIINKFAFNGLKNIYNVTYLRYRNAYLDVMPQEFTLATPHYTGKTTLTNFNADEEKIKKDCVEKTNAEWKAKNKKWALYVFPFLAVLCLVLASVFAKNIIFAPIGFCLFAINLCATLVAVYRLRSKKLQIEEKYIEQSAQTKQLFKAIYCEYEKYLARFERFDSISDKITKFLSKKQDDVADSQD